MSFGTYARRARDRTLPYGARYRALRDAVSRYCPIGFNATWAYLSTMGDVRADEEALIRALGVLETSRSAWLAELNAFAGQRRVEKRKHRRSPTAADRRRLYGYRWPGPDGHTAVLHEVKRLWAEHLSEPFPQTPVETKGDLVYLDSTIAGCVSTYLSHGGQTGVGHRDILLACLADLRAHLRHLGYPTTYYAAFGYFRRLHKLSELIISDTTAPADTQPAGDGR